MKITNKIKDKIAPEMFGLFFEDINFAADGGLYAEMIENRSFEAKEAFGIPGKFYTVDDFGYGWYPVFNEGEKEPRMQYVCGTPLSTVNPHYLRFTSYGNGQGFKNKAYDGITLKKGMKYKISFYARVVEYSGEGVKVVIRKDNVVYAEGEIKFKKHAPYAPYCDVEPPFISGWTAVDEIAKYRRSLDLNSCVAESDWVKYDIELTAEDDIRGADFLILHDSTGVVEYDLVSMFPEDAICGVFRKDLFEALNKIHPGFIRFPGGCIVEGISLENRYAWKNTIGELKDRKYIPNLWAFNDNRDEKNLDSKRYDSHYGQSYGLGYYEYFLLCEKLGAKPLPVLGIGAACQFRSDEMVDVDNPEFDKFIDDALDLIEFANGDDKTTWGAVRSAMGHKEPFNLEMVGIGNEQWETTKLGLFKRLDRFESAIHSVYPEIKIVGTAGPHVDQPMAAYAWENYRARQKEKPNYCYAVDEHYYVSPEWMYDRVTLYDNYPREVSVFAGEYAAHVPGVKNNMAAALAEAAFLTGIEKNAGVVKLASYAPLFNRIGHTQWQPDMIWFDDRDVYLTPNYYVQMLYANNVGEYTLDLENQDVSLREEKIYISAVKALNGDIIIKAANCSGKDYKLELNDADNNKIISDVCINILKAIGDDNINPQPSKVDEIKTKLEGELLLKADTFTVCRIAGLQ